MSGNAGNLGASGVKGRPKTPPDVCMPQYDELPKAVRERLQSAVFDWDPYPILCAVRGGAREGQILMVIENYEAQHAKRV